MTTVVLLFLSNCFMTFAWYGHLKYGNTWPLWKAILVSWVSLVCGSTPTMGSTSSKPTLLLARSLQIT